MDTLTEEDMFAQSQPVDQEAESDMVYLELAKALTERKCRIVQKKEKIKLLVNKRMKQFDKSKMVLNEEKHQKKDIEEVIGHHTLRVQTMENDQKFRLTLETTLCNLSDKVTEEKTETKRKKDEFDAAIKDAYDTWKSYKTKYDNFLLAKKLKEVKVEIKLVEIALKLAEMDIFEYKRKKLLKRDIAERKFQKDVILFAEMNRSYHQKVAERKELLEKILKTEKLMADIKTGKTSTHQLEPLQGPKSTNPREEQRVVKSLPETVNFTLSGVQVLSPQASESEKSQGGNSFSWCSLLDSSTGSAKISSQSEKSLPNKSVGISTLTSYVQEPRVESQQEMNPYRSKDKATSWRLTNLLKNIQGMQRTTVNVGFKRTNDQIADRKASKEERPPIKKSLVVTPQSTKISESGVTKSKLELDGNPSQPVMENAVRDEWLDKENKENKNKNNCTNSSVVQSQAHPLTGSNRYKSMTTPYVSKTNSQNLRNILSLKDTVSQSQKNVSGSPKTDVHEQAQTVQNIPTSVQVVVQRDQQKMFDEEFVQNVNTEGEKQSKRQEKPMESIPILLEPGSPAPDLIPVETNSNSQPLSQGNVSQTCSPIDLVLSGDSEFTSPIDENTKKVYQRLVSQGPYPTHDYSIENTVNSQNNKPNSEKNVVRSHYFSSSPTLNTPPESSADGHQSSHQLPFSPLLEGEFGSSEMINIQSPPPANTAAFGEDISGPSQSTFALLPSLNIRSLKNTANKTVFDFF